MEKSAETTSPKFKYVLRLLGEDSVIVTLINDKVLKGKIVTFDSKMIWMKVEDRHIMKSEMNDVIVPISSILMIKPVES